MSDRTDIVLTVPADITRKCRGLALDFGGSVLKCVYRSKEDETEIADETVTTGHLHLASFPRSQLREALEYVEQEAQITRANESDTPLVYATGIGCSAFGKLICDNLRIRLKNVAELACFAKAFVYLSSRLPRSEFLEPFIDEATAEPIRCIVESLSVMQRMSEGATSQDRKMDAEAFKQTIETAKGAPSVEAVSSTAALAESEDVYPCLLVMCGSGIGMLKIEKDGSFQPVDVSRRGGMSVFAVGKMLTGCKTFAELIELASQGDSHNVDVFTNDLVVSSGRTDDDDSVYTAVETLKNPSLVFCFGKIANDEPEKFRREDIARSWINHNVLDLVQCVTCVANVYETRRIFFCGSYASVPLIRSIITTEIVRRNMTLAVARPARIVQFDFVRPGPHLGALGCLINTIGNFAGK